jgi:hypothetical protein
LSPSLAKLLARRPTKEFLMSDDFAPVRTDKDLIETFEMRRSNASDEATRLIAAELHNISDTLLELLKYARVTGSRLPK